MFLQLVSVVVWCLTVTGYGVSLSEATGKRATPLNNSSLAVILGDQCVTRDEVQAIVSAMRDELRSEIQETVNHSQANVLDEIQTINESIVQSQVETRNLILALNPALSCKHIPRGSPSGNYWIASPNIGTSQLVYCDMTRRCCGSTGGWMRVADLDMTDPNQQCPSGFRLVTSPVRACGRHVAGCLSTTFQTHGIQYSKVCGKIIGYQQGTPDAFFGKRPIDSDYVDAVSLTHGQSPRKHIWTFAAAHDESESIPSHHVCSCTCTGVQQTVQSFIGQDYFCETGSRSRVTSADVNEIFHTDPLWNGQGCGPVSTCCYLQPPSMVL